MRWRGVVGSSLLCLTLAVSGCSDSHRGSADPLAGVWHVHTYYLTISSKTSGAFNWPTHVFCGTGFGEGPPQCDTLGPGGRIGDGGHAHLVLSGRRGSTATGTVVGSSQPSVVPDGPVELSLGADDVLYLRFSQKPQVMAYDYLCGARTDRSAVNCGA